MANKTKNVVSELLPPEEKASRPALSIESTRGSGSSMWRILLQLRVLLPYVPRLLEMVTGIGPASGESRELRQGVEEMQAGHRDLRRQVQDQGVGMKRLEEQLIRLREESERHAIDHSDLLTELKTLGDKLRVLALAGVGLVSVATVLLVVILVLLLHR
jgi:hypothetical protein